VVVSDTSIEKGTLRIFVMLVMLVVFCCVAVAVGEEGEASELGSAGELLSSFISYTLGGVVGDVTRVPGKGRDSFR
jgi:hypothetical protein